MACSISAFSSSSKEILNERDKIFYSCLEKFGSTSVVIKIFSLIMEELSENPEQDLLGDIYVDLNLSNNNLGQFFTPYSVSKMMAEMNLANIKNDFNEKGFITISDSSCGAGSTLIAAANIINKNNISLKKDVLFFAQDIDMIVALMCYIQLFIIGARGMVIIGDSLSNPITEDTINNANTNENIWIIP